MNSLLISSKISGVKNIDEEIELSFVKKNFDSKAFDNSFIKTIYGSNGSGKSGIVHAYDIFRFVVTSEFPFKDNFFTPRLRSLINKKTKTFSIENVFATKMSDKIHRYRYSIGIAMDDEGGFSISHEMLVSLNSRLDDSVVLFETRNGEFLSRQSDAILDGLTAQVNQQNAVVQSIRKNANDKSITESDGVMTAAFFVLLFAYGLDISYGSADDRHESIDFKLLLGDTSNQSFSPSFHVIQSMSSTMNKIKGDRYAWIIKQDEEGDYENLAKKLCQFLKLLTPSLENIQIGFKHDGLLSYCELRFFYDGYDVDYEFESTGIKKLCGLFLALSNASRGQIVIIDEIDAGIHDVFLTALVEYFALYNHCQIIMTTHHIGLMDSVKHISKSINVLTDDHRIVAWTKDGDSSPSSLYRKGYLEGVPFNLKPIDFAEIFHSEDDE